MNRGSRGATVGRRTLLGLICLSVGLLVAAVAIQGEANPTSHRSASRQIVKTYVFPRGWDARCDPEGCGNPTLASLNLRTSSSYSTFDLVVTATLDYRVSAGDELHVSTSYGGEQRRRLLPMRPGDFPLSMQAPASPAPPLSTTTMSWAERGLKGQGKTYRLVVGISPRDRDGDGFVVSHGRRLTLVVRVNQYN